MPTAPPLALNTPQTYLHKYFEPAPSLRHLMGTQPEQFFVLRIEDMYRHVRGPVPAVRSAAHTALFITSGAARMAVGYDHYTAGPDELLLVPAGQVHSFEPHDVNTGFLCHFHPDLLRRGGTAEPEFLTGWGHPLLRFESAAAEFIRALFQRMLTVYQQQGLAAQGVLLTHLAALLAEASHAYQPQPGPAPSAAVALTQAFKRQLSQRVRQEHRVAAYAESLHITPNHLNKVVRATTGKSPTRWIDEALVLEAKALLFQTTLPVAEVAALVGVPDASYFSRLFKKLEGHSPSALRQAVATNQPPIETS
jgi:AraC family transcriptional activator of pobA